MITRSTTVLSVTVLALLLCARPTTAVSANGSDPEFTAIAAEAYIYAYPLVLMDITRRISTGMPAGTRAGFGPMNQFSHMRAFPSADFREVVRPNFDTFYSSAWLDLRKEPVIVSVPDTEGRYYMLPILDMWTDVVAVPGKHTSGTSAQHFAIVGPGWKGTLPEGVHRISVPTPYTWIIGRTQTNGPADYANVHRVQDGYRITTLSGWTGNPRSTEVTSEPPVDVKTAPLVQVNNMSAEQFFTYAAELLMLHAPHATDGSMLLRMKRIGLEPGKPFDAQRFSSDQRAQLREGARLGLDYMKQVASSQRESRDGWVVPISGMGVYGNDYLRRAVIAMTGLGANPPEDAVYPNCQADANGEALRGGRKYVLHFDANRLPPVSAFWSVTMYDGEGFPTKNPIDRFAIGDRDPVKYNADGSLDIYIQSVSPGKDKESNWLPSPEDGSINLTMRLYAPDRSVLNGSWTPPSVRRVP